MSPIVNNLSQLLPNSLFFNTAPTSSNINSDVSFSSLLDSILSYILLMESKLSSSYILSSLWFLNGSFVMDFLEDFGITKCIWSNTFRNIFLFPFPVRNEINNEVFPLPGLPIIAVKLKLFKCDSISYLFGCSPKGLLSQVNWGISNTNSLFFFISILIYHTSRFYADGSEYVWCAKSIV